MLPVLRYLLLPRPQRHIAARVQFVPDLLKEFFHALRLDGLEGNAVTARRPIIFLGHRVRSPQRLPLADVNVQTPETPVRFSLRLGIYLPSQVLQTNGRRCHFALASRLAGRVTNSRAPSLHGRYPASTLLRTRPTPSRLRPLSRCAGYTAYLAPPISRRDEEGLSSCLARPCHHAVDNHPAGVSHRLSLFAMSHAAFAIAIASSASGAKVSRPPLVRLRYGLVTRRHPYDGVVGRLQGPGFPTATLLPKLRGSDSYPGGTDSHRTRQPSLDAQWPLWRSTCYDRLWAGQRRSSPTATEACLGANEPQLTRLCCVRLSYCNAPAVVFGFQDQMGAHMPTPMPAPSAMYPFASISKRIWSLVVKR